MINFPVIYNHEHFNLYDGVGLWIGVIVVYLFLAVLEK